MSLDFSNDLQRLIRAVTEEANPYNRGEGFRAETREASESLRQTLNQIIDARIEKALAEFQKAGGCATSGNKPATEEN
jgi:hypothetical protein